MERKTMGSFIAVLRKSSGMTQKELADKLNVSDKTISHWERDENAPDLSMIPVLAEIFGVTCDEILLGERKRTVQEQTAENTVSEKGEKQIKYLLEKAVSKLRISAVISCSVIAFGFILGIALNLLLETSATYAAISYFIAVIFYIAAVLISAISRLSFKSAVFDIQTDEELLIKYKQKANSLCVYPIFAAIIFAVSSVSLTSYFRPLDYMVETLLINFAVCGGICLLICVIITLILKKNNILPKKIRSEKQKKHLHLRVGTTVIVCVLFAAGIIAQINILDARVFLYKNSPGIDFYDPQEFKEYMETPKEKPSWVDELNLHSSMTEPSTEPITEPTVTAVPEDYTENDDHINADGHTTITIRKPNSTDYFVEGYVEGLDEENSTIWVTFKWLNAEVRDYCTTMDDDESFYATVFTYEDVYNKNAIRIEDIARRAGYAYYPLAVIIPIFAYYLLCVKHDLIKKSRKKTNQ